MHFTLRNAGCGSVAVLMNASPLTMLKPKFPLAIYHLIVVNVMGPYIDCHFKQLKAFLGLWYGL